MDTLTQQVIRLANERPELRKHLVPLIRQASGKCVILKGGARKQYEDAVWDMYVRTYSKIGLIISNSAGLVGEFDIWDLCLDGEGNPRSFLLSKSTAYGVKGGLSGFDGSNEGKRFALDGLRKRFRKAGTYSELSHKPLQIALASGAPVVCATHAAKVLRKDLTPADNGVAYTRIIKGVGPVKKVMVGQPKGVPTTNFDRPECPSMPVASFDITADDLTDVLAHMGNSIW